MSRRILNLLPGWGYRATVWAPLLAHLPPGWEANPVDLPWAHPAEEWTQRTGPLALGLRPGWCLGWSLGGTLALELAQRGVAGIEGVVLLASTPCWLAGPGWAAGLEAQAIDDLRAQVEDQPESALRHFNALASLGAREPSRVRAALAHHLLARDEAPGLARSLSLLQQLDARAPAPSLPLRVIEGGGDRLLPGGIDAAWLRAADVPVHRLSQTGHVPQIADPAAVAAILVRLCDA